MACTGIEVVHAICCIFKKNFLIPHHAKQAEIYDI